MSRSAGIRSQRVDEFLDSLAGRDPTPGGGSTAAVAGATGAALVAMVGRLTTGKKGYEDVTPRAEELVGEADAAREAFLLFADRDAEAFDGVMAAFKLPKDSAEQRAGRSEAIGLAFEAAATVPLRVARLAVEVLALALESIRIGNVNAASDGAAGAQVLSAAARSAIYNVEINLGSMKDASRIEELRSEVEALENRCAELLSESTLAFHRRLSE